MALRIATFNLKDFFLPRDDSERAVVDKKLANVAANLRRAAADVVALQEVGEPEMLERLLAAIPELGYGAPLIGTEDKRGIRCAIVTRLPVLSSQVHAPRTLPFPRFYEADPEPFPHQIPLRRGVVHVRVDAGALGEVDVLTAHFKSNRGAPMKGPGGAELEDASPRGRGEAAVRSLVQRVAEALFLRGLVDDVLVARPDHAVCVLGDLNDRIDSLPVRVVAGLGEPGPGQLRPCAELVPEELRFSCYHGKGRSLIDHILVSERLHRALRATTIQNEELRDHGAYEDDPPLSEDSDHALAVASFEA
jgi:endonuclease/exonuclease/phosphatase family metal-dependent hydrolase